MRHTDQVITQKKQNTNTCEMQGYVGINDFYFL